MRIAERGSFRATLDSLQGNETVRSAPSSYFSLYHEQRVLAPLKRSFDESSLSHPPAFNMKIRFVPALSAGLPAARLMALSLLTERPAIRLTGALSRWFRN
jgi:hypothetical protein